MILLTLRTDKPDAELGLFHNQTKLTYSSWQAHRQLAENIHLKIKDTLASQKLELKDIEGIVVFKGPGSFTGLRIGISVANALADSLCVPIVSESGEDWLQDALGKVIQGENEKVVQPEYGALPHITQQKR